MSTNNRSSRRQKKVPSWFSDHVMGNSSQKKNDNVEQGTKEEIRVEKDGLNEEFGENDVEPDKGVFGNMDNSQNQGENSDAHKDVSDVPLTESEIESTSNNNDKNFMDSNENDKNAQYDENVAKPNETNKMNGTYLSKFLVKKGCERWNMTACGYFVGYRMSPNKLRYNIRRMYGKYGVRDIRVNNDGTCLFKFSNAGGLRTVIDKGLWMVNNRPFIVQQWNHEIGMQKVEHSKLPVWVRMIDVPLEA
ncbi:RNA-directed DNA polymerase, eukaryota, reverse transcriptase zinc-binding domain protein [Tanacetum coccineum]